MTSRRNILKTMGVASLAAVAGPGRATAGSATEVTTTLPDGESVSGYLAMPEILPAGAVLLIHEARGLDRWIRKVTRQMAEEGFIALAADLYDGEVAHSADEARRLRRAVKSRRARATLVRWIDWLQDRPDCNGRVGTVGWCYGGGWALNVSMATPVAATVVYYGHCDISSRQAMRLAGPVMGHFATGDRWIDRAMVTKFESSMQASGKEYEIHWYKAGHAFANPNYRVHSRKDAELAWSRTIGFFRRRLT